MSSSDRFPLKPARENKHMFSSKWINSKVAVLFSRFSQKPLSLNTVMPRVVLEVAPKCLPECKRWSCSSGMSKKPTGPTVPRLEPLVHPTDGFVLRCSGSNFAHLKQGTPRNKPSFKGSFKRESFKMSVSLSVLQPTHKLGCCRPYGESTVSKKVKVQSSVPN